MVALGGVTGTLDSHETLGSLLGMDLNHFLKKAPVCKERTEPVCKKNMFLLGGKLLVFVGGKCGYTDSPYIFLLV